MCTSNFPNVLAFHTISSSWFKGKCSFHVASKENVLVLEGPVTGLSFIWTLKDGCKQPGIIMVLNRGLQINNYYWYPNPSNTRLKIPQYLTSLYISLNNKNERNNMKTCLEIQGKSRKWYFCSSSHDTMTPSLAIDFSPAFHGYRNSSARDEGSSLYQPKIGWNCCMLNRILKGPGVVIPLIFPKVPESFLGILRVPQLPPPLEHPPP